MWGGIKNRYCSLTKIHIFQHNFNPSLSCRIPQSFMSTPFSSPPLTQSLVQFLCGGRWDYIDSYLHKLISTQHTHTTGFVCSVQYSMAALESKVAELMEELKYESEDYLLEETWRSATYMHHWTGINSSLQMNIIIFVFHITVVIQFTVIWILNT